MIRLRPGIQIGIVVVVLAITALGYFWSSLRQERAQIRARYQLMTIALTAGDTNAVLSLIAPAYRSSFDGGLLSRLQGFAQPLGPRSAISIRDREATVWPVRIRHYHIIPGGDTVEMIKVDDTWFFTGKVHVD